jgi:C4-dicarboxylate-binding protein DctP
VIRDQLEHAMRDATRYEREIAASENESALAAVRASGRTEIHVLPAGERARWREALLPVHRRFEPVVGRGNLEAIYRAADEVQSAKAKNR